jgi:hypothetical protein
MNRQARLILSSKDTTSWSSYGAVTFEEAARLESIEAHKAGLGTCGRVQVRDESEPEIVHTLTVERVVEYRVTNLRGGE